MDEASSVMISIMAGSEFNRYVAAFLLFVSSTALISALPKADAEEMYLEKGNGVIHVGRQLITAISSHFTTTHRFLIAWQMIGYATSMLMEEHEPEDLKGGKSKSKSL